MEIYDKVQLAQLAARLRLNAANGNAANGAAPGYAVRAAKGSANRAPAASAQSPAPAAPKSSPVVLPPSFSKLKLDVEQLIPHLSNAYELYTPKSAVSRTANQLYGTMLDVVEDSDELTDDMLDDGTGMIEDDAAMIEEGDIELEAEALRTGEVNADADGDESGEWGQVAGSELDASA